MPNGNVEYMKKYLFIFDVFLILARSQLSYNFQQLPKFNN